MTKQPDETGSIAEAVMRGSLDRANADLLAEVDATLRAQGFRPKPVPAPQTTKLGRVVNAPLRW